MTEPSIATYFDGTWHVHGQYGDQHIYASTGDADDPADPEARQRLYEQVQNQLNALRAEAEADDYQDAELQNGWQNA